VASGAHKARPALPPADFVGGRTGRAPAGLRAPCGAGSRDQPLLGAGLEPARALRLEAPGLACAAAGAADIRGAHRNGAGTSRHRYLRRVPPPGAAAHHRRRLQHAAVDGDHGASLLRLVRLPGRQLLRRQLALRHAGGAQGTDRRRPRRRYRRRDGPDPLPRRPQRARWPLVLRRHHHPVLPRRLARLARGLGLALLRLRQDRRSPLPALELPLLARRVPLRRLPLRRRHQHALPAPRLGVDFTDYGQYFDERGGRGRLDLLRAWPTR
jgi:hypothetical protein